MEFPLRWTISCKKTPGKEEELEEPHCTHSSFSSLFLFFYFVALLWWGEKSLIHIYHHNWLMFYLLDHWNTNGPFRFSLFCPIFPLLFPTPSHPPLLGVEFVLVSSYTSSSIDWINDSILCLGWNDSLLPIISIHHLHYHNGHLVCCIHGSVDCCDCYQEEEGSSYGPQAQRQGKRGALCCCSSSDLLVKIAAVNAHFAGRGVAFRLVEGCAPQHNICDPGLKHHVVFVVNNPPSHPVAVATLPANAVPVPSFAAPQYAPATAPQYAPAIPEVAPAPVGYAMPPGYSPLPVYPSVNGPPPPPYYSVSDSTYPGTVNTL